MLFIYEAMSYIRENSLFTGLDNDLIKVDNQ